jgi:hypothetical protein
MRVSDAANNTSRLAVRQTAGAAMRAAFGWACAGSRPDACRRKLPSATNIAANFAKFTG